MTFKVMFDLDLDQRDLLKQVVYSNGQRNCECIGLCNLVVLL